MALNVAVIGAGTVGGGVVQAFASNGNVLRARAGRDIRLTHVCDVSKDNLEKLDLKGLTVTNDAQSLFANPDIHVVCELIGGEKFAKGFILDALRAKKHVVTANKLLLAKHGRELAQAAIDHGVELRYEAAVAGAIPIIKALREGLVANRVRSIYGILNGTCNYILTRMTYENLDFPTVLKQAQAAGFAETPPDLDVLGHDTAHKSQILASLCFDTHVPLANIAVDGITRIAAHDISDARDMGYIIKLLAIIKDVNGEIDVRVHPTLVPETHLLASVRNEMNAIYVESDLAGPTLYYGRGAGRLPTASAVISDIADIARRGDTPPAPPFRFTEERPLRDIGRLESEYYLRFTTVDTTGVLGKICTVLGEHHVSIASCSQKDPHGDNIVHVVIVTHNALESDLRAALDVIDRLDVIKETTHVLRVLSE
jgi:homoserine dehydrogenase